MQRLVHTVAATVILPLSASRLPPSKLILERFAFCGYTCCTLHMQPGISLPVMEMSLQASMYQRRLSASSQQLPAAHLGMKSSLLLASVETVALQCRLGSGHGSWITSVGSARPGPHLALMGARPR